MNAMQNVMTMERPSASEAAFSNANPTVVGARSVQTMPLSFQKSGDACQVVKVRGGGDLQHHLRNLGFVEGAPVRVVSEQGGNLIVEVKGARIAIDKTAASKVMTR